MWKDYSKSYIKNNRAASSSIMAAALIATLFLSLLCCLFFNFWVYEVEQIKLEEGDWQARITGNLNENDLSVIGQFANVENAVINEALSDEETVIDLYFQNIRTIYEDMPQIITKLGLEESAAEYHSLLLSRYFINDPQDETPPLLLPFYAAIFVAVFISLILIIRNSFEISMNARIHQFGIFASIGATPKQIRTCLLQEAAVLCFIPILLGSVFGIGISYTVIELVNLFAADVAGRHPAVFQYHPVVFLVTFLSASLTVLFSAWIPARKLNKMTPLEAIHNLGDFQLKRRKHSRVLSWMFGIEGELAGNALKARKRQLRISTISLLLSFLGFTIMLCFFTLSQISTRYTYFERYQDAWDVMVTVKNTELAAFDQTNEVKKLLGVQNSILYQKAEETSQMTADWQSEELMVLGGIETIAGEDIVKEGEYYRIKSPIIIMDDESFLEYASQIGAVPSLEGTIVLNRIWDNVNSNFRNKQYIPFVKENRETISLYTTEQTVVDIPILSYTQKPPVLREEYDNNTLVLFMPLSMWEKLSEQMNEGEPNLSIRVLAQDRSNLTELNRIETALSQVLEQNYSIESENRIQEKRSNDEMIQGSQIILGSFCGLLAVIGIANVFSNTLGFLRQRKREFAQYLSIGFTPANMKKMFFIEAFVIAGRPIFITLPLTVVIVMLMISASYLDPMVFWREAPIFPIFLFALVIIGFVSLAYYIGGKQILECDLNEVLKNDAVI